jgi:hypothetical protein
MTEFVPLILGIAIALLGGQRLRHRRVGVVAACVVAGATASWLNGELGEPGLILFDAAQALVACVMTAAVVRRVVA